MTAIPIKIKSAPIRLSKLRTTARNVIRTSHSIVASIEKIMGTPQGSENYSSQGIQIKISLSIARSITRRSSRELKSFRQNLPSKNISMKR